MDQMENHFQEAVTGPIQEVNNMSLDGYQIYYGPTIITCLLHITSLAYGW